MDQSVKVACVTQFQVGNRDPEVLSASSPWPWYIPTIESTVPEPDYIVGQTTAFARRVGTAISSGGESFEVWNIAEGPVSNVTTMIISLAPPGGETWNSSWYSRSGGLSNLQQYVLQPMLVLVPVAKASATSASVLTDFEGEMLCKYGMTQQAGGNTNLVQTTKYFTGYGEDLIERSAVTGPRSQMFSVGRCYAGCAGPLTGVIAPEQGHMVDRQRVGAPFSPYFNEPDGAVNYPDVNMVTIGNLQRFSPFPARVELFREGMEVLKLDAVGERVFKLKSGLLRFSGEGGDELITHTRTNTAFRRQWTVKGWTNDSSFPSHCREQVTYSSANNKDDRQFLVFSRWTPFASLGPYNLPLLTQTLPTYAYAASGRDIKDNTDCVTYVGEQTMDPGDPLMLLTKANEAGYGANAQYSSSSPPDNRSLFWREHFVTYGTAYNHTGVGATLEPGTSWSGFGPGVTHFPPPSLMCAHAPGAITIKVVLGFPVGWGGYFTDRRCFPTPSWDPNSKAPFSFRTARGVDGTLPAYVNVGFQDHYVVPYLNADVPIRMDAAEKDGTPACNTRRMVVKLDPAAAPRVFPAAVATQYCNREYVVLPEPDAPDGSYCAIPKMSCDAMNAVVEYVVPNTGNNRWIGTSVSVMNMPYGLRDDQNWYDYSPPVYGDPDIRFALAVVINEISVTYKDSGTVQNEWFYAGCTEESCAGPNVLLHGLGEAEGGLRFENARDTVGQAGRKVRN